MDASMKRIMIVSGCFIIVAGLLHAAYSIPDALNYLINRKFLYLEVDYENIHGLPNRFHYLIYGFLTPLKAVSIGMLCLYAAHRLKPIKPPFKRG